MRHLLTSIAILAFVAAALFAVKYWFEHSVKHSFSYCVEAEFGELPDDDQLLTEWLRAQVGVVPHTVFVRRFGENGRLLETGFIQVRTATGDPAFPVLAPQVR